MKNDMKGKKLLIIGGLQMACNIVLKAHDMGIYVIVVDHFVNSPAKQIADKSYLISTNDVSSIVKMAQDEKIDGIITGYLDSVLPTYQKVCSILNLPCYATAEQIIFSMNKDMFKKKCRLYGVPVVNEYHIDTNRNNSWKKKIQYPVVVKPADSSSSRGISVCYKEEDLSSACEIATQNSDRGRYIIEQFHECPGINVEYHLNNGEIMLESIMERRVTKKQYGYAALPIAFLYPSAYLKRYLDESNTIVVKMFKELGLKNGTLFMSAFVTDEKIVFYEMGYRLGGALAYKYVEHCCNYSPMEMIINFALTGKMTEKNIIDLIDPGYHGKKCLELFPLLHLGIINKIKGMDIIKSLPNVIAIEQKHFVGDEVTIKGSYDQILARILVQGTYEKLVETMKIINISLEVFDIKGNSMLMDMYCNEEDLHEWYFSEWHGIDGSH